MIICVCTNSKYLRFDVCLIVSSLFYLLKSFSRDLYTKIIPISDANASSVNLVKYRTTADPSVATIIIQNSVALLIMILIRFYYRIKEFKIKE